MKHTFAKSSKSGASCAGEIRIGDGLLSVDCRKCINGMDLSDQSCFNGLSGRLVPGFRGMIVQEGVAHRSYEGPIIEALMSHSLILSDIRNFAKGPSGTNRGLSKIARRMESDLLGNPLSLERSKMRYIKDIRRAMKNKDPPEVERFRSILEAITVMVKKLERDISRKG